MNKPGLVLILFFMFVFQGVFAKTGALFDVSATGEPADLYITLCLDGRASLSCQKHHIYALNASVRTTIPNHIYAHAGIKINTPGYTIPCTLNQNGFCLFSISNTTTQNVVVHKIGQYVLGGTILGLTGSGLVLQNNGSELSISSDASTFQFPEPILYGSSYNVTVQTQPPGFNCVVSNGYGSSITADVSNILITCYHQYGYIGGYNGFLYDCDLTNTGFSSNCVTTPASGAPNWRPNGIAFAVVEGTRYAYVADNNKHMYQCTLNIDGTFNVCTETPASGAPTNWVPAGITFATIGGTQYAYVGSYNGNMYQCTLNMDGSFNVCTATPASGAPTNWAPSASAFAVVNGVTYAYTVDRNRRQSVYQCTLNNDGSFNLCTSTPASGSPTNRPVGITFFTTNGTQYAYVSGNNGHIYQCSLNADGSFDTCTITPSSNEPSWIPVGSVSFFMINGIQYVFVTETGNNVVGNVYQCTLNSDGSFNTCAITPPSGFSCCLRKLNKKMIDFCNVNSG